MAIKQGDLDMVKLLHSHGANLHITCQVAPGQEMQAILLAAKCGHLSVVDYIL